LCKEGHCTLFIFFAIFEQRIPVKASAIKPSQHKARIRYASLSKDRQQHMKTFIADIFPRIQRYSEKLDNITLLANQHWVSIDDIISTKTVYIFRTNNELLISTNGKVEKERWEYLGNKSLLIDKKNESFLFKHGFFDENILALKVDSCEEYAVFVNENNYDGELNSIERVFDFLRRKYLDPTIKSTIENTTGQIINPSDNKKEITFIKYETDKGQIAVSQKRPYDTPNVGNEVFQNGKLISNGKFRMGFMWYIYVENGKIVKVGLT